MKYTTTNYTKTLIDVYHVEKPRIALVTGAGGRTVERWYKNGETKPIPIYYARLKKLLEKMEGKKK